VFVARLHHHKSAYDANTDLVVLANVMAPGLPIHRSTFFVGGDIGLAPPTNLLQKDGLKWGGGILLLPVLLEALGDSDASCSFGGTYRETLFLAEVYLLFVFHFWFFLVDCYMVHCPSFASCLDFFWVSSSISHFFCFHLAMPYEIVGGCWYIAVDTLRYSRLTFLLYPSLSRS
jgi:hypothetical protein